MNKKRNSIDHKTLKKAFAITTKSGTGPNEIRNETENTVLLRKKSLIPSSRIAMQNWLGFKTEHD